jgi:hypothetical protein
MPGGIIGLPYHWGTQVQGPCLSGWGLDARLKTLLCKIIIDVKSKEVGTSWSYLLRKVMDQKGCFDYDEDYVCFPMNAVIILFNKYLEVIAICYFIQFLRVLCMVYSSFTTWLSASIQVFIKYLSPN